MLAYHAHVLWLVLVECFRTRCSHACPCTASNTPTPDLCRCELQEPSHGSHPLAAVSDYTAYLPRGLEHLCLVISVGSRDLETKVTSAGSTQARQHAWEETAAAMANLHAALLPSTGLELELDATGSKGYRDSSDDWHYKQNTSSQLFTSGAARAYFRPVASRLRALTCYAMRIAPAVIREAQALPFLQKLQFTGCGVHPTCVDAMADVETCNRHASVYLVRACEYAAASARTCCAVCWMAAVPCAACCCMIPRRHAYLLCCLCLHMMSPQFMLMYCGSCILSPVATDMA